MRKAFPISTMMAALFALGYLLHSSISISSVARLLHEQPRVALVPAIAALLIAYVWVITIRLSVERTARSLRQQIEEQKRQREMAEAGNRAKGELLAHMSHEIRTPMNAILGFTELALKSDLNSELHGYLDTVRTSAKWLMHVINDIFDFSCLEADKIELTKSELSIAECIRSAIEMVQAQADQKKLLLKHKIEPRIPSRLIGDRARLEQIIVNLLDNALKFTSTGSVLIWATLETESEDTAAIRISIADTGMGIPLDRQEFLFQPFHAPADSSAPPQDAGVGLAICRKLAELMGGAIEVQSQIGAGSTFSLRVILEKVRERTQERETTQASHEPISILIAEDDAASRHLLTRVLESAGYRVTGAANGEEAVRVFQSGHFDAVLMDISMPEMDGLEAVRRIRRSEPAGRLVPIWATTAHTMPGDRQACLEAGMDGFITKPLAMDEVLQLVSKLASGAADAESGASEAKRDLPADRSDSEDGADLCANVKDDPLPEASASTFSADDFSSDPLRDGGGSEADYAQAAMDEFSEAASQTVVSNPVSPELYVRESASYASSIGDSQDIEESPYSPEGESAAATTATAVQEEAEMAVRAESWRAGATEKGPEKSEPLSPRIGLALLEAASQSLQQSPPVAKSHDATATAPWDPFAEARKALYRSRFDVRLIHNNGDPSDRDLI